MHCVPLFEHTECHSHVEQLMSLAVKHNVAIIPFGGGTNVTGAVECSPSEQRMIVSLDSSQMVLTINSKYLSLY